jgi:acetyltransferase-like isoleucine patch superfamily enzyme
MKAYLFETGTAIEPFGDPVSSAFLGGETLGEAVSAALLKWDVTVEKVRTTNDVPLKGDYLVLPDTLFLTRRCAGEFLKGTSAAKKPARLALPRSPVTEYARPLTELDDQGEAVAYDLFRIRGIELPRGMGWAQLKTFLAGRTENTILDPEPGIERLPQTRPGPPRETLDLPRTTLLAADVRHWVHLVWINHQLPWLRLKEYWEDHAGIKRFWRSRGGNPYRKAARLSVIGRNCDIHPTALVEGSILGDKVTLGAFTSVRDSIIGDGVEVSEHTKFLRCVVGKNCHTLNDSYFIGCTFYPDSTLANFLIRNSVLGRRVFLTSGVMFWDEAIEAPVEVMHRGKSVPTGRWILGGCAGHECILGTRAIFLPGRTVPNQTMIVMRPEEGLYKLPPVAEPGRPYVYHQGLLQPLEQALPHFKPPELE